MTDRVCRQTLIEYVMHCGTVAHEDFTRRSDAARMETLSLADAIAADLAFDDAIAGAIEREAGNLILKCRSAVRAG